MKQADTPPSKRTPPLPRTHHPSSFLRRATYFQSMSFAASSLIPLPNEFSVRAGAETSCSSLRNLGSTPISSQRSAHHFHKRSKLCRLVSQYCSCLHLLFLKSCNVLEHSSLDPCGGVRALRKVLVGRRDGGNATGPGGLGAQDGGLHRDVREVVHGPLQGREELGALRRSLCRRPLFPALRKGPEVSHELVR